jgi:predicted transcriptional regulator
MTLTVRLDAALQAALERHCAERGLSKTLVVQESLAQYLVLAQPATEGPAARQPSASYRAFADAGLIGAVGADTAGNAPADKAGVRQQALRRLAQGGGGA